MPESTPLGWTANKTLTQPIIDIARNQLAGKPFKRLQVLRGLYVPRFRFALEAALTEMALEAGAIPVSGDQVVTFGTGTEEVKIFVGSWLDLLQWLLDNAPAIIELILSIISLFNAGDISLEEAAEAISKLLSEVHGG